LRAAYWISRVSRIIDPQEPRSLASEEARRLRTAALEEPHILPLTNYVRALRARDDREYPYFDPADGGVEARLLLLFEKPGPMTVQKGRQKMGEVLATPPMPKDSKGLPR
jgi:hypothetical protein